jgi:hypothetical protein
MRGYLRIVLATALAIDEVVHDHAVALAGDFGLAILEQLYVIVEDDGHSSVDAAVAL